MANNIAVLTIHGMGDTERGYSDDIRKKLSRALGSKWGHVHFGEIYYQDIFQDHQKKLFDRYKKNDDIDWIRLRRFLLYGFSDAAGFERQASLPNSAYEQVQNNVLDEIDAAYDEVGEEGKVVIVAHSLGCHIISNYIWDAQCKSASQGAWCDGGFEDSPPGSGLDKFRRLKTLKYLYFSGCNIPIFIAGIPQSKIQSITSSSRGYSFKWKNFYDPDDALGWPLKNLNTRAGKQSYKTEVNEDSAINVGGVMTMWNPLSHNVYWKDKHFLNPLIKDLKGLIA